MNHLTLGHGSARLGQGRRPEVAEEEALRTGLSLGLTLIAHLCAGAGTGDRGAVPGDIPGVPATPVIARLLLRTLERVGAQVEQLRRAQRDQRLDPDSRPCVGCSMNTALYWS